MATPKGSCILCNTPTDDIFDVVAGNWYCMVCWNNMRQQRQNPIQTPCITCGSPATTLDNGADWYCNPCYTNLQSARQMYAKRHPPKQAPPSYKCTQCGAPLYASGGVGTICGSCQLQRLRGQRTATAATQQKQQASQRMFFPKRCMICLNDFWTQQAFDSHACMNPNASTQQAPKGGTNVPISCTIYWDDSIGGYAVSCGYKPQFIEFLKTNIPASDRAYHPNTKTWTFHEKYFDIMFKMAETVFGTGSVNAKRRPAGGSTGHTPVGTGSSADPLTLAFAKFARLLPHDVLKKAYREAAGALHPDKGGDPKRMADLNEVWAQIKATLP